MRRISDGRMRMGMRWRDGGWRISMGQDDAIDDKINCPAWIIGDVNVVDCME